MSVFQSDAKTKNEIRSSKPFFKVRRKPKTRSKIQICFSMPCENEKLIWHLNSFLPCHRRTVGTKVHTLFTLAPTVFRWQWKTEFKFNFHFLVFFGLVKQYSISIPFFVFRLPVTLKNGFGFCYSFIFFVIFA